MVNDNQGLDTETENRDLPNRGDQGPHGITFIHMMISNYFLKIPKNFFYILFL